MRGYTSLLSKISGPTRNKSRRRNRKSHSAHAIPCDLRSVQSANADIPLLVNADGKIVLPKTAAALIAAICAAAHCDKHEHVKHAEM